VNWEGSGRRQYYPNICLDSCGNPLTTSIRMDYALAEIQTYHLPNTNLKQYHYTVDNSEGDARCEVLAVTTV
jgi:hypothetical protein